MALTGTTDCHHGGTTPEGIVIEWDVPIQMDDGLVLRADLYRPAEDGRYQDRPAELFEGTVTVHTGGERQSYLLLPVVPPV
jgi:predicted acyl esterase